MRKWKSMKNKNNLKCKFVEKDLNSCEIPN